MIDIKHNGISSPSCNSGTTQMCCCTYVSHMACHGVREQHAEDWVSDSKNSIIQIENDIYLHAGSPISLISIHLPPC